MRDVWVSARLRALTEEQRALALGAVVTAALLTLVLVAEFTGGGLGMAEVIRALLIGPMVGFFYYEGRKAALRRRRLAARLGLRYSAKDPVHLDRLPLPSFSRSGSHKITHVAWGMLDDRMTYVFDYAHAGPMQRGSETSLGILIKLELDAEPLLAVRRGMASSPGAADLGSDVTFESDEFNRRIRVECRDSRFAYALIDQRMMEWLMRAPLATYQCGGSAFMVLVSAIRAQELERTMALARSFVDQIPRVMWSLHGVPTSARAFDDLQ